MPTLFIGHGSPMNALENNEFTKEWSTIAKSIPRPRAILCISAHWLNNKTAVLSAVNPRTIYDFYGFPEELYSIKYPAPGSLEISELIRNTIKTVNIELSSSWGFDHGSWSVLSRMYPKADIPVVQLSINPFLPLETHMSIGKELSVLRKSGVLIIGSGNIVHNLSLIRYNGEPFNWALKFGEFIKHNLIKRNTHNLLWYNKHKDGLLAVPTNDHYIPLLYVYGASNNEEPHFFCDKVVLSSLSMTCVVYGLK